ncbi:MAG: hypothetical protein E6R08_04830 [Nevskiaceae bacterium]|nr:MAG: hypothetical protein E6R08_04830 [Nevskiaceae bacterium]
MATNNDFKPLFNRVQQADRHDDVLAVIASLGGTTLDNIRQQAEVFGLPQKGPYYPYIDADLIAKLLTSRGLVGTVWKESKEFKDLPDVAIAMVDYDADWEVGRCVLFHRLPADHPSKVKQYVIDPYPDADAKLHVRTDLTGLNCSWFIGVHPAPAAKAKAK